MKRSISPSRNFVPKLENLEDRTVLSGNVNAAVLGGILEVVGDNSNNSIAIVAQTGSTVFITPTDGKTTIDGKAGIVEFSGITKGIYINLGNGNNNLEISGVTSGGVFWINGGVGKNTIGLGNVLADKSLDISLAGSSDDSIYVNASIAQNLYIRTAGKKDQVAVLNSKFGESSTIDTTGSDATLSLTNDSFGPYSSNKGFATAVSTDLPIATNDKTVVATNGKATINVLANDTALVGVLVPSKVTIVKGPTEGSAVANKDGTITYTNSAQTSATDTIEYTDTDSFGNVSNVATVTIGVGQSSNVAPTVTVATADTSPSQDSPIPFTADFSQNVSGFKASSITVANGTVSNFVTNSAGKYSFDVTPTADGTVTVTVPAGAVKNGNGLANTAGSASIYSLRTASGIQSSIPAYTGSGFTTLSNGLSYETVQSGPAGGTAATSTSTVTVFYNGWLTNGTLFNTEVTTGSPTSFDLNGGVIAGFQQGIAGMKPGDVRIIYIPSALGYGATGSGTTIPPNSNLVFEVKLIATT